MGLLVIPIFSYLKRFNNFLNYENFVRESK